MTQPIQTGPRPLELARELAQTRTTRGPAGTSSPNATPNAPSVGGAEPTTSPFAETLAEFAQDVNTSQVDAERASRDFAEGRSDDIHGTMIQLQEADVKLRLLGNVRNRALEAYREIMRMGA